jgi:hypothetical protein
VKLILLQKIITHKVEVAGLDSIDTGLLESLNTTIAEFIGKIGENVQL